jgi:hypothetical protein
MVLVPLFALVLIGLKRMPIDAEPAGIVRLLLSGTPPEEIV